MSALPEPAATEELAGKQSLSWEIRRVPQNGHIDTRSESLERCSAFSDLMFWRGRMIGGGARSGMPKPEQPGVKRSTTDESSKS